MTVFIGLANVSLSQISQQEIENHKKYWNYRDRFKKFFVHIGSQAGDGIPIANRDKYLANINGILPCLNPQNCGYIRMGDAMSQDGEYLAVLATEYKLLKDAGGDLTGILNELYYAIEAINRLDRKAEPYLSFNTQPDNLNGFYMRDDAPQFFYQHWANLYPQTLDSRDDVSYSDGDAYNIEWNPTSNFNPLNEVSMDQLSGTVIGFAFVKKFVDNIYVQPTPSDVGFYLVDEVKAITERIMQYILPIRSFPQAYGNCDYNANGNWVVKSPVANSLVLSGGGYVQGYSYAVAKTAEYITGNLYLSPILFSIVLQANEPIICPGQASTVLSMGAIAGVWTNLQNETMVIGGQPPSAATVCLNPIPNLNPNICFDILDQSIPIKDFNLNSMLSYATVGGIWSHYNVNRIASDPGNKMYIFDLIYALLHDQQPLNDQSFYANLLSTAPCNGPYNIRNPFTGAESIDPIWNENSIWLHPFGPSQITRGEYNGNDYMLLYNLYQLVYKNSSSLPVYADNSCQCSSASKIELNIDNNDPANLLNNIIIYRRFPQYVSLNIKLQEFLTQDLNIPNAQSCTTQTDLVVCNNSTLDLKSGSNFVIASSFGDAGSLIIRNGSTLVLRGGSTISVQDKCKILIEPGANLIYEQGANIELLGNDALLEIQGNLHIGDNANFTFTYPNSTSGYVKFSAPSLPPTYLTQNIFPGTNCSITFIGTGTNDKVLEITQESLYPDNLVLFKIFKGKVVLGANQCRLNIGCPMDFKFVRVTGSGSGYEGSRGIHLYGQSGVTISSTIIEQCQTGISAFLFYGGNPLAISSSTIKNCGVGLYSVGMGVNLTGVGLVNNSIGWMADAISVNCTQTNCTFSDNDAGYLLLGGVAEVKMDNCNANNNNYWGGEVYGNIILNVKCGQVNNNLNYGLLIANKGNLWMNTTLGGGLVEMKNNPVSIQLMDANIIDLDQGYNELRATGNYNNPCSNLGINCPQQIVGTTSTPFTSIPANFNKWRPNNNTPINTDYYTNVSNQNFQSVTFVDANQQQSLPNCNVYNPNNPTPNSTYLSILDSCPGCNTVNTASFINKKTNQATKFSMQMMDSILPGNYSNAVGKFYEILKYPLSQPSVYDKHVLNISGRKMQESLLQGISTGQIGTGLNTDVLKVIEILDDQIADAGNDTSKYRQKLYASVEKAINYRLANRRDLAIPLLDNILAWARPEHYDYVMRWRCIVNTENLVLTGQLSKDSFLIVLQGCLPVMDFSQFNRSAELQALSEDEELQPVVGIYPNPVTDFATLAYQLKESETGELKIYSVLGEQVRSFSLPQGKNLVFDTSGLNNGVYFYYITTNQAETISGKFIIAR
ncbi:MAG: T9SS type A sorting domain-containing protein [Bacteroidota bacterium]